MKIIVKANEQKEIFIDNNASLDFVLENNASLLLKYAIFNNIKNITINGKLKKNAVLKAAMADFSNGKAKVNASIELDDIGANANWDLASLATGSDQKQFDISFIHNHQRTIANMNNYGVALNSSRLVFSGINYIKKKAKKSQTNQNAKIIVFDQNASGKANPILKIDENDVLASHAAIVGRLNDEHLFYLKSRGLNEKEAKALIVNGYLKPIANHFESKTKLRIEKMIQEKCHV
ncbi:MAG: SufD family Fe-S cluster assembly protein [Bacilli bacterium]|nr:SufD family Fe-S cluster assembly protein [Bacilli bacterium]